MKFEGIVVSGLPGSGKSVLTNKLSEKLDWKVFSVGKLWRTKYNEMYPNKEISFEEFWRNLSKEEQAEMDNKARETLKAGNAIGEFRFAKSCEGLPVLFVFLTAELDVRAKRAYDLGKYSDVDEVGIRRILKEREEDEVRIGKELFGQEYDYRDLGFYGLILDSGELSLNEEVAFVLGTLEGKEKKQILKEIGNLKV